MGNHSLYKRRSYMEECLKCEEYKNIIDALRDDLVKASDKTFKAEEYAHLMWGDKLDMQFRMKRAEEESLQLKDQLKNQFDQPNIKCPLPK